MRPLKADGRISFSGTLSLAPGFSPVKWPGGGTSRFNGFLSARPVRTQTVETVWAVAALPHPAEAGC